MNVFTLNRFVFVSVFAAFCSLASFASAQKLTGVTPFVSAGAVSSLVAKTTPGSALDVQATNLTATAGFLVGYNAVEVPADGALTAALVIDCVALPASGSVRISDEPGPSTNYTVGITYIITSASTCYTKTTGVVSAFIKAKVQ